MKDICSNCVIFKEFPSIKEFITVVLMCVAYHSNIPRYDSDQEKIFKDEIKQYIKYLKSQKDLFMTTDRLVDRIIYILNKLEVSKEYKEEITKEIYKYNIVYDVVDKDAYVIKTTVDNIQFYCVLTIDEFKRQYNVVLNLHDKVKIIESDNEPIANTPESKIIAVTERYTNDYYTLPIYIGQDAQETRRIRKNLYRLILEKGNINLDKVISIFKKYNVKVITDHYEDDEISCYTKIIHTQPNVIDELAQLDCVKGIDKIIK